MKYADTTLGKIREQFAAALAAEEAIAIPKAFILKTIDMPAETKCRILMDNTEIAFELIGEETIQ